MSPKNFELEWQESLDQRKIKYPVLKGRINLIDSNNTINNNINENKKDLYNRSSLNTTVISLENNNIFFPIVVFPSTLDLRRSISRNSGFMYNLYNLLLPKNYPFWIMGYPPDFPEDISSEYLAKMYFNYIKKHIFEKYGKVIIVAVSYGGSVAIPFSALFPDFINALILISSVASMKPLDDGTYGIAEEILEIAQKGDVFEVERRINMLSAHQTVNKATERLLKAEFDRIIERSNPLDTLIRAYDIVHDSPLERAKYLPQIVVPTLIIAGELDQFFPQEAYKENAELIPNARLEIIPNATHIIFVENFRTCRKLIKNFLIKNNLIYFGERNKLINIVKKTVKKLTKNKELNKN